MIRGSRTESISIQSGSVVLRSIIVTMLGMGFAASAPTALAQSYCDSTGCYVFGTPPGDGGGGGSGGWGGAESTFDDCSVRHCTDPGERKAACDALRASKPSQCPNPIPFPRGYAYGTNSFPSGSGLARVIYFIEHQTSVSSAARQKAKDALGLQTTEFARMTVPFDETMGRVNVLLVEACDLQLEAVGGIFPPGALTESEKQCLRALDTVLAEQAKQKTFLSWFIDWTKLHGLSLSDLGIPQSIVDALSPKNSLTIKYEKVTTDAICSRWWEEVEELHCEI